MPLAGLQHVADLHDADSALCFGNVVFPLLRAVVREHVFQLLGGDEEDIVRKDLFYVIVLDGHVFFGFPKHLIYGAHHIFKRIQRAVLPGNDLFPVPLIHVDGVDIVGDLIPADGAHVRIKPFALPEAVFFQRVALPFGKGLHHLRFIFILFPDPEGNGPLHAV